MSEQLLRNSLVRLAYSKPKMRPFLLPLLRTALDFDTEEALEEYKKTHKVKPTTKLVVKKPGAKKPSKKPDEPTKKFKFMDDEKEQLAFGQRYQKSRSKWTGQQKRAVGIYTGDKFKEINEALRAGFDGPDDDEGLFAVEHMDTLFDSPLGRLQEPLTVTRGVGAQHPLLKMIKEGKDIEGFTFKDKGYTSSTINSPEQVEGMGSNFGGVADFIISVPKGAKAIYVGPPPDDYSESPRENELLLNRGTSIKITKVVKTDDGKFQIFCEAEE